MKNHPDHPPVEGGYRGKLADPLSFEAVTVGALNPTPQLRALAAEQDFTLVHIKIWETYDLVHKTKDPIFTVSTGGLEFRAPDSQDNVFRVFLSLVRLEDMFRAIGLKIVTNKEWEQRAKR